MPQATLGRGDEQVSGEWRPFKQVLDVPLGFRKAISRIDP